MAIKVNGTTVIDDSRNLSNVGGLKTINSTSILGSGNISAGASTTNGAVGTYVIAGRNGTGVTSWGGTFSGSNMKMNSNSKSSSTTDTYQDWAVSSSTLSGTWRHMAGSVSGDNGDSFPPTLWVRIS